MAATSPGPLFGKLLLAAAGAGDEAELFGGVVAGAEAAGLGLAGWLPLVLLDDGAGAFWLVGGVLTVTEELWALW
jgi:hypothetical protein